MKKNKIEPDRAVEDSIIQRVRVPRSMTETTHTNSEYVKKVNQSRYRPGQAQRVPGS